MGEQTQLALVPRGWPEAPPTRYRLKTATVTLEVRESGGDECCGSVGEAVSILQAIYRQLDADQDHFVVLCLNARNRITGYKVAASGGERRRAARARNPKSGSRSPRTVNLSDLPRKAGALRDDIL